MSVTFKVMHFPPVPLSCPDFHVLQFHLIYTVSQKKACDAIYLSIIRILIARL